MKNSKKAAFSVAIKENGNPYHPDAMGLTKREYFAAMAMQGMLAGNYPALYGNVDLQIHDILAEFSRGYADALLAELEKTE